MFRKFSTGILALLTICGFAHAQEATSQGNATNFILIDYGFNLSADSEVNDSAVFGNDEDAGETSLRIQGSVIDDTDGFIGIGIGHRYANNLGAVLRYETGEMESGTLDLEIAPGSGIEAATIDNAFTTDVDSFFLEGAYFMPYSERIELWGLVGIGQAEVTTSTSLLTMTIAGETGSLIGVCSSSEDNTATRFGVGATYYLSQTQGFYGGVTISNYGDASFKVYDDDNDVCTNAKDTLTLDDIEATDLRIGYFRSF